MQEARDLSPPVAFPKVRQRLCGFPKAGVAGKTPTLSRSLGNPRVVRSHFVV